MPRSQIAQIQHIKQSLFLRVVLSLMRLELYCTGNRICILHEVTQRVYIHFCVMNLTSFVCWYDLFNHHILYSKIYFILLFYIFVLYKFAFSYWSRFCYNELFLDPPVTLSIHSIYLLSLSKGSVFTDGEEKNRWRIRQEDPFSVNTRDRHAGHSVIFKASTAKFRNFRPTAVTPAFSSLSTNNFLSTSEKRVTLNKLSDEIAFNIAARFPPS